MAVANTPGAETSAAGKKQKDGAVESDPRESLNEVPEDYEVKLTRLRNGQAVDSGAIRCCSR